LAFSPLQKLNSAYTKLVLTAKKRFGKRVGPEHETSITDVFNPVEDITGTEGLSTFRRQMVQAFDCLNRNLGRTRTKLAGKISELERQQTKWEEQLNLQVLASQKAMQAQNESFSGALASIDSQLAALRDYAATQQETLVRYQQGFNWVITKDLCKRIIRCLDDIEGYKRADGLTPLHSEHLETIYDQLLFALDSCGVEQVRIEPGTPYDSVRKEVELVGKDTAPNDESRGKVSYVLPGYGLYTSDSDKPRSIRDIQVRVFE